MVSTQDVQIFALGEFQITIEFDFTPFVYSQNVAQRLPKPGQSLADRFPDLAAQADGWDPTTVTYGSHRKLQWICEKGHKWVAIVKNRNCESSCPICSGRKAMAGVNDLTTLTPELAAQADGWDTSMVTTRSARNVGWKCNQGHRWTATVANRSKGSGCPYCSGRKAIIGETDLATLNPRIAAEADGWDPSTLTAQSNKKVKWKCQHGHTWLAPVYSRSKGIGCPMCSGYTVITGETDLATINPDLAKQADGWDPSTLTAQSSKKVKWKCELGHTWVSAVSSRFKGVGCPLCSGYTVIKGETDLATVNPKLAAQAHGWDPTTLTVSSGKKVGWKCDLGHTWSAVLASRSVGSGCPVCAGQVTLPGFNDLATTNPFLAAQANGWDPKKYQKGSDKKMKWKCPEEHVWVATIGSRDRGYGCPTCATSGFDPNQDAWLYLIQHDSLDLLQVGISNFPEGRLKAHSRRGWEVVEVRGPMEGRLSRQLEKAILESLVRRGAVLGQHAHIEKFDGYSEAWTKDSLVVTSFKQLLGFVYEDDESTIRFNQAD